MRRKTPSNAWIKTICLVNNINLYSTLLNNDNNLTGHYSCKFFSKGMQLVYNNIFLVETDSPCNYYYIFRKNYSVYSIIL